MSYSTSVPLVLSVPMSFDRARLQTVRYLDRVDWVEVRADLHDGTAHATARNRDFGQVPTIYALRNQEQGGRFGEGQPERVALLTAAVAHFDLIELDGERDLIPAILQVVPPEQRLIAWYGPPASLAELTERLRRYERTPARFYKLVPATRRSGDELAPLQLLQQEKNAKLISYAAGPIGRWTQIVAAHFGSALHYTQATPAPRNDHFALDRLVENYGFPHLHAFSNVYGIVGNPVFGSLSPRIHNDGYRRLDHPGLYLPFHIDSFDHFWQMVRTLNASLDLGFTCEGFTVVSPFKAAGYAVAEAVQHPILRKVEVCNVLVRHDAKWYADSTDAFGIRQTLQQLTIDPVGLRVAVLGCGGAGRTMAAGLQADGAQVLLVNRTRATAEQAATQLGLPYQELADFSPQGWDVIINATPVGKKGEGMIVDPADMKTDTLVVDMTYGADTTPLVRQNRLWGRRTISGRDMLVVQVRRQFELLVGLQLPPGLVSDLVGFDTEIEEDSRACSGIGSSSKNEAGFDRSRRENRSLAAPNVPLKKRESNADMMKKDHFDADYQIPNKL